MCANVFSVIQVFKCFLCACMANDASRDIESAEQNEVQFSKQREKGRTRHAT